MKLNLWPERYSRQQSPFPDNLQQDTHQGRVLIFLEQIQTYFLQENKAGYYPQGREIEGSTG